jgi:hypothetical protein
MKYYQIKCTLCDVILGVLKRNELSVENKERMESCFSCDCGGTCTLIDITDDQ